MLPPFVPPSVRASAETLPLITEFVVNPVERSFKATFSTTPAKTVEEPVQPQAHPSTVTPVVEAAPVVAAADAPLDTAPSLRTFEPPEPKATLPSISDFVAQKAAAEPAASTPAPAALTAPVASAPVAPAAAAPAEPVAEPTAAWVDQERNAFDWQSVAQLAPAVDDAQRADDEWTATDWDQAGESDAEHVSTVLMQLARRVRSGELHLEALRGASVEATLASVLAALLADEGNDAGRVMR